jgi:ribosomal protein S18 acetylase RimI-like enzyme
LGDVIVDIKIHNDLSKANWEEMKEVYHSLGCRKQSNDIIKKVFEASNVITIATCNERIVGFGRAISDGVFNAAIYDVVVHRDFQNLGIAKKIMNNLLDNLKHISCVHLISTTGNEEFYRKVGLKKLKTGMARYVNPDLAKEYLEE